MKELGNFARTALLLLVSISLSGCVNLNHQHWTLDATIPSDDQWRVIYANQWPGHLQTLYVLNATKKKYANQGTLMFRVVNAEPGEDLDAVGINDTGELDFTVEGTRRYIRVYSGDRIWVKSSAENAVIKIKVVDVPDSSNTQGDGN